jgi:methionyl-tRNA formyltransferase
MSAFDTIILLTGEVEQPVLASILLDCNPHLTIRPAATSADLSTLAPEILRRARLIAFSTNVIVPAQTLEQLGYGAYNFHPGPPHFPGSAPAHFAVRDGAMEFGATAHVMTERVDSGPIVGAKLFPVPAGAGVVDLEALAYAHLAQLFRRLAKFLATQAELLPVLPISWSGRKRSRRLLAALDETSADFSEAGQAGRI